MDVYKNGKVFGNRDFVLHYKENGKSTNRLGVVVSKKVSKKAVDRNKIRRQVKEYLSTLDEELKQGYDLIVSAKPNCLDREYKDKVRSIRHLFLKKGLLK